MLILSLFFLLIFQLIHNRSINIYFDMEQTNVSTSLQNILLDHHRQIGQQQINKLFQRKEYPNFQLQEFYKHPLLHQHDKFHFFLDILEEWNRKIQKEEIPNFSQTLYQKNIFIYDTIKNSTLQSKENAIHMLDRLYQWFNRTRNTTVKMLAKKQKDAKPFDQEWEIRNTFKSNLPTEIGMYRRRIFWNYDSKDKSNSTKNINQNNRKVKTQILRQEIDGFKNEVEEQRIVKIQNSLVRADLQRKEFLSIQNKWKLKKYRECQAGIKNYYDGVFSNNKTYFPKRDVEIHSKDTDIVTLKRVKTSLGIRSSLKKMSSCNRYSQAQTSLTPKGIFQRSSQLEQFGINKQNQLNLQKGLAIVDGLKLLANPFEKKLKKKKRRN